MDANIVIISRDGRIVLGPGYTIGQILEALEAARRIVLGLVPRPLEISQPTDVSAQE